MKELIDLLEAIATNKEFHLAIFDSDEGKTRELADGYFNSFKTIYNRIERHKYSEVSKYIGTLHGDVMDSLREGIHQIIIAAQQNYYDQDDKDSDNKKCYISINKLYDHIELEVLRVSSIERIKLLADTFDAKKDEINSLLDEAKKEVKETEDKSKHLSEQLISILGIFAGIVTAFAFAVTTIGEAMANLTELNATYLAFIIVTLGLVFTNAIVLLMTFVTKLSGHSVSKKFPFLIYVITNILLCALFFFLYKRI